MTTRIPPLFCLCGREFVLERAGLRLCLVSPVLGPYATVEAEELRCTGCGNRVRRPVPGTDATRVELGDVRFAALEYDDTVKLL